MECQHPRTRRERYALTLNIVAMLSNFYLIHYLVLFALGRYSVGRSKRKKKMKILWAEIWSLRVKWKTVNLIFAAYVKWETVLSVLTGEWIISKHCNSHAYACELLSSSSHSFHWKWRIHFFFASFDVYMWTMSSCSATFMTLEH